MEYSNVIDEMKDKESQMHLLDEEKINLENKIKEDIKNKFDKIIVIFDTCDREYDCKMSDFLKRIYINHSYIKVTFERTEEYGGLMKLGLKQLCKVNELFDCKVVFDMDETYIYFMVFPYEKG